MLVLYLTTLLVGGSLVAASILLGGHDHGDAEVDGDADLHHDMDLHGDADLHAETELHVDGDVGADADLHIDAEADADLHANVEIDADADGDLHLDGESELVEELEVGSTGGPGDAHDAGLALVQHASQTAVAPSPGETSIGRRAVRVALKFVSLRFLSFFAAFFGLTGTVLSLLGLVASQAVTAILSGGVGFALGAAMVAATTWLQQSTADTTLRVKDYIGKTGAVLLPVVKGRTGKIRLDIGGRDIYLLATTDEDRTLDRGDRVFVISMDEGIAKVVMRFQELGE